MPLQRQRETLPTTVDGTARAERSNPSRAPSALPHSQSIQQPHPPLPSSSYQPHLQAHQASPLSLLLQPLPSSSSPPPPS